MTKERTMVNIYPPALERSTSGDIISMMRFMLTEGEPLEIIAADIYALTGDLVEDFILTIPAPVDKEERAIQENFKYVLREYQYYNPRQYQIGRILNLVVEGQDAVERISRLMGDIRRRDGGVTILGRYGYYSTRGEGRFPEAEYPASAPATRDEAEAQIDLLWTKYKALGGPHENVINYPPEEVSRVQQSLMVIKPNAFEQHLDPRLGDVIDAMSKSHLYMMGAKVIRPTPEEMAVFYSVHKDKPFFHELVDFMSSKRSLALLYEGVDARDLVRTTALDIIRLAYTDGIMENTVHTSDSPADFEREHRVIDFGRNLLPSIP